jgi:broad specificity phosphatase PhoE
MSGKTWDEMATETGKPMLEMDNNLQYDYSDYGGETNEQVKARVQSFLQAIRSKHPNDKIVAVTHYGIIKVMESLYPHKQHHKLGNASVHEFHIDAA